jgi:hypothetical protein
MKRHCVEKLDRLDASRFWNDAEQFPPSAEFTPVTLDVPRVRPELPHDDLCRVEGLFEGRHPTDVVLGENDVERLPFSFEVPELVVSDGFGCAAERAKVERCADARELAPPRVR